VPKPTKETKERKATEERYLHARTVLRTFLASRNETQGHWARSIKLAPPLCSNALLPDNQGFHTHRHRLRIEEAIGQSLWNEELEREQLAVIGKKLGLNILRAKVGDIRRTAIKRGVTGLFDTDERFGFGTFRALLVFFFPSSPVADLPHYRAQ
jgi:hypothetical protein